MIQTGTITIKTEVEGGLKTKTALLKVYSLYSRPMVTYCEPPGGVDVHLKRNIWDHVYGGLSLDVQKLKIQNLDLPIDYNPRGDLLKSFDRLLSKLEFPE